MADIPAPAQRAPITVAELEQIKVLFLLQEKKTLYFHKNGKVMGESWEYELYPGPLHFLDDIFEEIFSAAKS